MDVRCKHCQSLNRVDQSGGAHYCSNCGMKLEPAGSSSLPKSGNSIYVPCPFCKSGFYVPADTTDSHATCSHCEREVDLCQGHETLVMGSMAASEIMPAISEKLQRAIPDQKKDDTDDREVLGNYRLDSVMGTSCLGTVYIGTQLNLNRPVMLYMLNENLASIPQCANVFIEQARKCAGLVHPNVARVYDVASIDGKQFMVSELVRGRQLMELIQEDSPMSPDAAMLLTAVAARALAAAHSRGLMHLSLSPRNLFVTDPGQAKLMNFGVMKAFLEAGSEIKADEVGITFFAPEFLGGREVGYYADLYSLGASVFYCLTGRPPYSPERALRIIRGDLQTEVPDIKVFRPDVPDEFAATLQTLIQPDPQKRPFRCEDLVVKLETIMQHGTSKPAEASLVEAAKSGVLPSPEARRRYKRLPAAMNVAVTRESLDKEKLQHYQSKLKNVSENGAFVLTSNPLPSGTFVRLEFALARDGSKVRAVGIVRWQDDTPGQVGMGVQFIEVSTISRQNISQYVDEHSVFESLRKLNSSALHKAILRYMVKHFGDTVPIDKVMQGTGASRMLFERAIKDFVKSGLIEYRNGNIHCCYPENESVLKAIERILNITH